MFYDASLKGCIQKAMNRLQEMFYTHISDLSCEVYTSKEPLPFERRFEGQRRALKLGESWGGLFDCGWFHFVGTLPQGLDIENLVIRIDIAGEGMLVSDDGTPVMGLTNVHSIFDRYLGCMAKRELPAKFCTKDGRTVDIWVDGACNDLFGGCADKGVMDLAEVAAVNENAIGLYYDLDVLFSLHSVLDERSARARRLLADMKDAVYCLSHYSDEEILAARKRLEPALSAKNGFAPVTLTAIGHAHLDLAWLWPERESIRKGARTFATALRMMERYPEYIFGASQAQLYQWIKDYYPGLYKQVKEKVATGVWDVQGAMWVEADTNLAGGEALIRQILYGKKFFAEEFGMDIKTLWLPDVFGYTGAFPQILAKCGIPYFFTNKLFHNKNKIPHHTFKWQGIDGTEILAHMTPAGTYGSRLHAADLKRSQDEYYDADVSDEALILYGVSDGGGGPGREHLERLIRSRNLDRLPPVNPGKALEFFERLEKNADKYARWSGELYFENHQGTYTTQSRIKKFNRKAEIAMRNCEIVCSIAAREKGFEYPAAELERIWKRILFLQFHDILPGSSIKCVYDEAEAEYAVLIKEIEEITHRAGKMIAGGNFNPTSVERKEYVRSGGKWYMSTAKPFSTAKLSPATDTIQGLENEYIRLTIDTDGAISSIYDKQYGRELLKSGTRANRFTIYPDDADAWELPTAYNDRPKDYFRLTSSQLVTNGPKAIHRSEYVYGGSKINQDVIMTSGEREIVFKTTVDWRETSKLLRTSFDIDIVCSEAICGIQFGQLKRPTHSNTSWESAKFEVCANRYVDLCENGYGVAMLSDSKYGFNIKGNVLDLCILRSPMWPGVDADKGIHEFVYTIYPHPGDTAKGGVAQRAELLNIPMLELGGNGEISEYIKVSAENIVVEAMKRAEDGNGYVMRLYEAYGSDTSALVSVKGMKTCVLTDMLENPLKTLDVSKDTVKLHFKPFEIQTVRFN